MRIASNIIDTIKAKADIVEVIGEYVHLTKKGQNYIGLCPFHNDSTPSLTVSSAKGIYKCFACDASGDVIKFLQEHLKISFVEAVKILANKYGREVNMIPRISYPQGISTADYLINGVRYDLKTIKTAGKNVLNNAIQKKKRQSSNFIFDISECPLTEEDIISQIERLW